MQKGGSLLKPLLVIQEHWASHHHFDLRLERDGVLKSWAVPKGIPLSPGERRLAIAVEDHALEYADFEGEILEGYGKGKVVIWDRGFYIPEKWEAGEILFEAHGEKMRGKYALIHTSDDQWLLIKRKEEKSSEQKKSSKD
ncbi:DNA polymerase ligase N-terminal domain-containing protein [Thermatribacter velox]|uniref:DNA polymerase ligase N-terminal domain-containing protein n=1 Tax=Thermatribacter velox TaxID=3039681 RepID=A0ABZ2Y961_9BACT